MSRKLDNDLKGLYDAFNEAYRAATPKATPKDEHQNAQDALQELKDGDVPVQEKAAKIKRKTDELKKIAKKSKKPQQQLLRRFFSSSNRYTGFSHVFLF